MLLLDLRYAIRGLTRARGFTAAVVVTLALGIGANTAIFSVVRGVLLRPLPHRDGDRLVYLRHSIDGPGGENILFSVPEIADFRDAAKSLDGVAEYSEMTAVLQGAGDAARINVGLVTGNFFHVMGLSPVLGRLLSEGDDGTGVPGVMVLTHEYWMKRFGGDSAVVGRKVRVDAKPVTIVGVVEPAPYFPGQMDALLNMVVSEHHTSALMVQGRTHRMTEVIARLAPRATLAAASAELGAIRARAVAQHPDAYDPGSRHRIAILPFRQALSEKARFTLWLLMGAAGFVMIITSANVANLTLMRGVSREHELVVRAALGAGAARLRRLLLVENTVLALLGAALGMFLAIGGVRLLVTLAERYSPRASEIRLDGTVLGFALALTLAVALLLSFTALLPKEGLLGTTLGAGLTRMSAGLARQRLQRGLVVAQIAASVILLTGAGLLIRTMLRLSEVPTGLSTDDVLTMELPLTGERSDADVRALYDRVRVEIEAIPGVGAVGFGSTVPLRTTTLQLDLKAEGRALAPGEPMPRAEYRTVSPEYFRAAGIPLVKGREFDPSDGTGRARVVILNQTLAARLFPDRDPIGRRVAWTGDVLRFIGVSADWRTVVGVVGDTKDGGLDAQPRPVMFLPFAQEPTFAGGGLVIRGGQHAPGVAPAATRLVRSVAPEVPVENVLTVAQIRDESVAPRRLNAMLISSFGILALMVAAVGIGGVVAFSVSTRTTEIGIRMSLGADASKVMRMVLREGGLLLAAGLVLGTAGAALGSRLIRGLLFGVPPHDPVTLAGVALAMALTGIAACWLPAARAARIDPAIAIRGY